MHENKTIDRLLKCCVFHLKVKLWYQPQFLFELYHLIADTRDVRLISEGPLFFPAGVLQQEVVFSIIPDSVSQEQNDRFVIRLSNRGTNFPSSSSLQLRLRVDIIDTDSE